MTIPTLSQYIARYITEEHNEDIQSFKEQVENLLAIKDEDQPTLILATQLRWIKIISVAIVEMINSEMARGEDYHVSLSCASRAIGFQLFSIIMLNADELEPHAQLIDFLTSEFEEGAKIASEVLTLNRSMKAVINETIKGMKQ